ncbi:hypothetical protein HJG60_009747 [Phyllostomus discolor]|uniref:Uncharacterized protein n=1 Tax=Phyllostomus discolor TaxID=89673 RepID=A0A834EQC8_9CHIR|nr:hypothetical protein HJG60_009747 [Phyllostomus discolor]
MTNAVKAIITNTEYHILTSKCWQLEAVSSTRVLLPFKKVLELHQSETNNKPNFKSQIIFPICLTGHEYPFKTCSLRDLTLCQEIKSELESWSYLKKKSVLALSLFKSLHPLLLKSQQGKINF